MSLEINNLHIAVDNKDIVKGLSLAIASGEVHVIMGPNGSGKSTLANTVMGHPKYDLTDGSIVVDGEDITDAEPTDRAKAGLFLSMQYPPEIEGVKVIKFMKAVMEAKLGKSLKPLEFHKMLKEQMKVLDINPDFAKRYVNHGFSGGEKKRAEILQLAMIDPKYAILDETDSGLDVDALKIVADGINAFKKKGRGVLLITHYTRILRLVEADHVHVMIDGKIVKSGTKELADDIDANGYKQFAN